MFEASVKDEGVQALLQRVGSGYHNARPLMRAIAGAFEKETEDNFAAQGRPAWMGLRPATLRHRGPDAKILQDSGQLAASVNTAYGRDFARIGSNKRYAAIHQFGGEIKRAPYSVKVRHRLDAQGNLLRTGSLARYEDGKAPLRGKGLVFAKDSHKRVRAKWFSVAAYSIHMPARPYMPFDAAGNLQPSARQAVETEALAYLRSLVST